MRDDKWFEDVEQSIMVAHAKIDKVAEKLVEVDELLNALLNILEGDEDGSEDPNLGH